VPHIEKDRNAMKQRVFDAIVVAIEEEIAEMTREDTINPDNCQECAQIVMEIRMTAASAAAGYYEAEAAMASMPRNMRKRACRFSHREGMRGRHDEHLKSCSKNCVAHKIIESELAEQN
jgi:hypothetical protein